MRKSTIGALVLAVVVGVLPSLSARSRKKAEEASNGAYQKPLPKDQRVEQALNRLTFGARPGDGERVKSIGLNKWIDLELHPNRIRENPVLTAKLKELDSLFMSSREMVQNYPAPQMVRQMVNGGLPYPSDPDRRMMIQKLVARFERRQQKGQNGESDPELARLLTADQMRQLRAGTPEQRLAAFEAIPMDQRDEVLAELPPGVLQGLFVVAPPELRRKFELAAGPQQVVARDLGEGKLLRAIYRD
jgi:hypothetical protein